MCSFVHSFIRSFVHSFIRSFVHSFIRSFVHLFICSFVHLFICSGWGGEAKMEPMSIERRNLLDVCKLVVKELLGNQTNCLLLSYQTDCICILLGNHLKLFLSCMVIKQVATWFRLIIELDVSISRIVTKQSWFLWPR